MPEEIVPESDSRVNLKRPLPTRAYHAKQVRQLAIGTAKRQIKQMRQAVLAGPDGPPNYDTLLSYLYALVKRHQKEMNLSPKELETLDAARNLLHKKQRLRY